VGVKPLYFKYGLALPRSTYSELNTPLKFYFLVPPLLVFGVFNRPDKPPFAHSNGISAEALKMRDVKMRHKNAAVENAGKSLYGKL